MSGYNFRSALIDIDNSLDTEDVHLLKFLCKDDLPHASLDKITRSLDLFLHLEQKGKLKEGKTEFLQECFHYMQRKDLIRILGGDPDIVEQTISRDGPSTLRPFRVMLYQVAEDVGVADLEKMKFYARNSLHLRKKQMENIDTCLDLLDILEREEHISPSHVLNLEGILEANGNEEIFEFVDQYKNGCMMNDLHGNTVRQQQSQQTRSNEMTTGPQPQTAINRQTGLRNDSATRELSSLTSINPPHRDAGDSISLGVSQITAGATAEPETFSSDLSSLPKYKMNANPPGLCLIINNKTFEVGNKDREGTDIDAKNLQKLFGNKLKFKVTVLNDLSSHDIISRCQDIAKVNHSDFDSFVMCVLSHGTIGAIIGTNGQHVQIKQITSCFTSLACPTLSGKPKLFFFQACQGLDKQRGYAHSTVVVPSDPLEVDVTVEDVSHRNKMIPEEADFLLGFSTVPGYVSYRSKSGGSFYINSLVEMLDKYAFRDDLLSVLIRVNDAVSNMDANMYDVIYKQVPAPQFTLTKQVIFQALQS